MVHIPSRAISVLDPPRKLVSNMLGVRMLPGHTGPVWGGPPVPSSGHTAGGAPRTERISLSGPPGCSSRARWLSPDYRPPLRSQGRLQTPSRPAGTSPPAPADRPCWAWGPRPGQGRPDSRWPAPVDTGAADTFNISLLDIFFKNKAKCLLDVACERQPMRRLEFWWVSETARYWHRLKPGTKNVSYWSPS